LRKAWDIFVISLILILKRNDMGISEFRWKSSETEKKRWLWRTWNIFKEPKKIYDRLFYWLYMDPLAISDYENTVIEPIKLNFLSAMKTFSCDSLSFWACARRMAVAERMVRAFRFQTVIRDVIHCR
jgi:hypothetical protein